VVDPVLADEAILQIEKMLVAEFQALLQQSGEGIGLAAFGTAMADVIDPFRDMTREARALIQQAGNPKH
jgi:hypothetical protein